MSRDYGEIFCDAVNQLIQSSLSTLNYDITKNCTVTNIDDRKCGKYQVFDGAIRFNAYAPSDVFYELNDSVLVTIPEGDFNKQATIINKIADPFLGSASYRNPFDTLLKGTENICKKSTYAELIANNEEGPIAPVITIDDQEFFGFTKIGLQADFSALLKEQNVVQGAYGLKLILYTEKNSKSSVMDFTFSSYDMFGNPYEFGSSFKQQIVFDIPQDLNCIKKIEVVFYQDNEFKNKSGEKIQPLNVSNLFVQNLEIYFGYEAGIKVEERVEISSPELTYVDETEKRIYLKWFHQVDENTLQMIQPNDLKDDEYSIKWYQYKPGCLDSEMDDYGGINWKVLDSAQTKDYPLVLSFKPSLMKMQEKIKAIVFVNNRPLVNNSNHVVTTNYGSNILIFENADNKTEGGTKYTEVVENKLSLCFEDNSDGNYFLYDQNGCLISNADNGTGQTRRISLKYGGEDIKNTDIFEKIRSITWQAPDDNVLQSMIFYDRSNFRNPNENLIQNVNKENMEENLSTWKTLLKDENNLSENDIQAISDKTAIVMIPIPKGESADTGIYTIVENNGIAGTYNFKSTVKVFSEEDDVTQIQLDQQVKVFLQVFISKDGTNWSQYPYSKTFMINPLEESVINTSFSILQEHKKLKIVIGYSKDQEYNTLPDNPRFFIWLGQDDTKFQLDADSCVNTYYPIVDENGNKTIQSYFDYSISTIWSQERSNNFIQCSVDIDGQVHTLHEILRFGPRGSNGTHNTFLLEMLDGKNALIVNDEQQKTLRVKAILLDASSKEIKIDVNKLSWELINGDSNLMEITEITNNICTITNMYSSACVPSDNYNILCAKYQPADGGPILQAFLPIAMKQKECLRMTGADRVIYNHLGTPSYSNVSYIAYMNDEVITDWNLSVGSIPYGGKTYSSPNPPSLKMSADGGEALVAAPLYSRGQGSGPIYDAVCVSCDYWSQPILIMQSNYDFAMLNEWDGSLTIDEKNGIILATMLGAGRKNYENKFSGVLIGDIKDGTGLNSTEKMTGVYGFQDGIMSYALKEDGSGFFGKDNCGRIEFNGEAGIIRSSGWVTDNKGNWILQEKTEERPWGRSSGTLLDLDDGMLLMHGDTNNYIKFNANGDGRLEMSIPAASINLIDSNGSSKNIIDFTTDSIRSTISKQVALKTRCGTLFTTPIKVIRMSEEDFLQWYEEEDGWKFENGTVISVKFNGAGDDQEAARPPLENILFKFAWYSDDDPNTSTPNYPTETTYPVASVNPNIFNTYKQGDTLVFEYDGSKFNLTDVGYSSMIQTTEGMISKVESQVRKVATYSATVSKLTNPLELTVLNAPSDLTAEQFYQDGTTLNVILGPAYTNVDDLVDKELKFKFKERNVSLYMHGAYVGKNNANFLTWKSQTSLCFMYRNTGKDEAWILVDSGSFQNFSEVKQTAEGVKTTVSRAGINSEGNINKTNNANFTMNITADGFYLNNANRADSSNFVFKCNEDGVVINGGGSFSGNLTAATTNFTELAIKGFYSDYEGSNQYYQTKINKNQITLAAEWTKDGAARAGQIYIGAPNTSSSFDDISIYAVPLSAHPASHGGYGNLGLSKNPWDMIYVKANESMRNVKERVEVYNIDQAYEELKNLPIYTYNYQGNTESCRTRFLGTMIDCLPTETIRITPDSDTQYFEPTSLTYWNIAATQAIQQKLENLDSKMNLLEEWMNGINSSNLD